jgi:hypothetical protein
MDLQSKGERSEENHDDVSGPEVKIGKIPFNLFDFDL